MKHEILARDRRWKVQHSRQIFLGQYSCDTLYLHAYMHNACEFCGSSSCKHVFIVRVYALLVGRSMYQNRAWHVAGRYREPDEQSELQTLGRNAWRNWGRKWVSNNHPQKTKIYYQKIMRYIAFGLLCHFDSYRRHWTHPAIVDPDLSTMVIHDGGLPTMLKFGSD